MDWNSKRRERESRERQLWNCTHRIVKKVYACLSYLLIVIHSSRCRCNQQLPLITLCNMRTFVLRSTVIPRKSESRVPRSTRSSFQIRDIFNGIVALDTNGYNTVLYCTVVPVGVFQMILRFQIPESEAKRFLTVFDEDNIFLFGIWIVEIAKWSSIDKKIEKWFKRPRVVRLTGSKPSSSANPRPPIDQQLDLYYCCLETLNLAIRLWLHHVWILD